MSGTYSKTMIVGRIASKPEAATKVDATNFRVAVDGFTKDSEADFYDVTAWKGTGKFVAEYCDVGDVVFIEGRTGARAYINREGEAVAVITLNTSSVTKVGSSRKSNNAGGGRGQRAGGQRRRGRQQEERQAPEPDPFDTDMPF